MLYCPRAISGGARGDLILLLNSEITRYFGGHSHRQYAFWYRLALRNQGTRADDRARAYLGVREDNGVHANKYMVTYRRAMHDSAVTDRTLIPNRQGRILIDVQHAVILNIGAASNDDGRAISSHDRIVPDAGPFANGDIANDHRARGNEDVALDGGRYALVG